MTTSTSTARAVDAAQSRLSLLVPCVIVLLGFRWTASAAWRSTFAILGRDQGIFQYTAWAIDNGSRAYADFREMNGPLIHAVHLAAMKIGGSDEHVFRMFDVVLSSAVFLLAGAFLPGIARRMGDRHAAPGVLTRIAWAFAGWVVLMSQYVVYGWWDTAQRESILNVFLIASLAVQLHAQQPTASGPAKPSRWWMFAIAGMLSALTWFGKPACLLYTTMQAIAMAVDNEAEEQQWQNMLSFGGGSAAAIVFMTGFVLLRGDLVALIRIQFSDVPRLYWFIWNQSFAECYGVRGYPARLNLGIITLVSTMMLMGAGLLPRRFLALISLGACGLVMFFLQRKCFPYHFHPVTAGTHLAWLGLLAWGTERAAVSKRRSRALVAAAAGVVLGIFCRIEASRSQPAQSRWNEIGATAADRAGELYVRSFPGVDFFAWDLRQAAAFLREKTRPADRVQTYGMDPYLLFLARRQSATPYIYGFELNVDAAMAGGSGARPDDQQRAWLLDTAGKHEADMLSRLQKNPPAAFALIDGAPFSYPSDSVADFEQHCPNAAAFMHERYRPAARFGVVHVWLRNDLAANQQSTGG